MGVEAAECRHAPPGTEAVPGRQVLEGWPDQGAALVFVARGANDNIPWYDLVVHFTLPFLVAPLA